mgnify:FL=1
MVKIAITGRQNIRTPNGKLHDDAGLKALDGIITEEYYVNSNSSKEIEACIKLFSDAHPGFDTIQAIIVE